jgi:hypothetical protein
VNAEILPTRALNRATLERQLLLGRRSVSILDAVDHLVGLQAQVPLNPYTALWSRLDPFDPGELGRLVEDRAVVRIIVMRATIHLVTVDDCLLLRPLAQPVVDGELARHPELAPALRGVDTDAVVAFARPLLASPCTLGELRAAMTERFPEHDGAALAQACRNLLALVQVPPRGVWGRTGQIRYATAEAWLGRPLVASPSIDDVVLRYLAAFGPATVADVSAWSRLTGMREVVDRLRPRLRPFRDERGRELVDLPDAPRPDPDTPAPVRFLPEYDNALLSHADRARFVDPEPRSRLAADGRRVEGTVLVDGRVAGIWRIERESRKRSPAVLVVDLVDRDRLPAAVRDEVEGEGLALLGLVAASAESHDVRLQQLP